MPSGPRKTNGGRLTVIVYYLAKPVTQQLSPAHTVSVQAAVNKQLITNTLVATACTCPGHANNEKWAQGIQPATLQCRIGKLSRSAKKVKFPTRYTFFTKDFRRGVSFKTF